MIMNHFSIIPDGNRRYQKKYKITLKEAYQKGIDQVFNVSKWFFENGSGVREISFFGFSESNWKREKSQVDILHKLFLSNANKFYKKKKELKNIRINFVGDLSKFSESLIKALLNVAKSTSTPTLNTINLALNYNYQQELLKSIKKMNISSFGNLKYNLQVKNDVDLVIRTGGHQRISGFLPIQSSNAEFYFTDKLWGEINEKDVKNVCNWYNRQKMNYGV